MSFSSRRLILKNLLLFVFILKIFIMIFLVVGDLLSKICYYLFLFKRVWQLLNQTT
jgi:hypothetical protein